MGDVRFEKPYQRVAQADDRPAAIRALTNEEVVMALAAASREKDPFIANVLATEALNRLRRSQAITSHLADGVVGVDEHGRITFVNPAATKALGYEPDELVGVHYHPKIHFQEDGTPMPVERCAVIQSLKTGKTLNVRGQGHAFRRKDGALFPVGYISAPVLREGEIVGAVALFRDITEEEQAEESLRRLAAIVQSSADAIIAKSPEGIITQWNPAAERMFGYKADDIVGKSITLLMPPERRDELELTRRVGRGQEVAHYETERVRKDGSRVQVMVTLSPLRTDAGKVVGLSAIYEDITERKRAKAALQESEARFRKVFEHAHEAIFVIDVAADCFVDVNPQACQLVGYTREELLTDVHPSHLHREELPEFQSFLEGVFGHGHGWSKTLTCHHRKGHRIPAEISASAVEHEGRRLVIAMVRDISERERARAARERMLRAFQAATDQSKAAIDSLKDVVEKATPAVHKQENVAEATHGPGEAPDPVDAMRVAHDASNRMGAVEAAAASAERAIDELMRLRREVEEMGMSETDGADRGQTRSADSRRSRP